MKYRIKEYLQAQGMTSKALADKLGITPTGLSLAITGDNFTMPRLEQIAKVFGVRVSDLLDESSPEESTRPQGLKCPHCGKMLYLATRPEEETRQEEPEPAKDINPEPEPAQSPERVPEGDGIPEPERVISPEPVKVCSQDGPQLSIFED